MLVKCGAANRGAAHAYITELRQETNNDACKSNDPIIRRTKISGHDRSCQGYAYQRGTLGYAGVHDIAKCLGLGNGHERLSLNSEVECGSIGRADRPHINKICT